MANTMTGRVLLIGNTEEIPSKNGGEPFKKSGSTELHPFGFRTSV